MEKSTPRGFKYLILLFKVNECEDYIFAAGEDDFENRMKQYGYEVEHISISAAFNKEAFPRYPKSYSAVVHVTI